MADSVVEIFNNTITNAQLSSGYDVVTTDANTTYVIKDVQVSGGYYDSIPATINNASIGDFSSNLSGSEIMGVSSTLNATAAEYNYENIFMSVFNMQTNKYESEAEKSINNTAAASESLSISATISVSSFNTGDYRPTVKIENSYYHFDSDGNSTTRLQYFPTSTSSATTLQSTAYRPMVYSIENQEVYYVKSDQGLYKHSPTNGESLIRSSLGSFSSYPRAAYSNGWFFYMLSSSQSTKVFCINIANGRKVTFSSLPSSQMSTNFHFAVSYDKTSDKFYIYRRDSSWDVTNFYIRRTIPSVTKTEMDALTSDQTYTDSNNATVTTDAADTLFGSKYSNTVGGGYFYGSKENGDELYFITPSNGTSLIEAQVWNYADMTVKSAYKSPFYADQTSSALAAFEAYIPNASEISSTNYDPPVDVRLRITGVETTTA